MLPSADPKTSALRNIAFSVLISPPHEPLPTLRLTPHGGPTHGSRRDVVGYSFVTGDLHPLPFASSPGAPVPGVPHSGTRLLR